MKCVAVQVLILFIYLIKNITGDLDLNVCDPLVLKPGKSKSVVFVHRFPVRITQTCPCNIQQFIKTVKMIIYR